MSVGFSPCCFNSSRSTSSEEFRNRLFSLTHAQDPKRRIAAKAVMRFKRKVRELQRNQSRCTPKARQLSGFFLKKKPPFTTERKGTLTLVPL